MHLICSLSGVLKILSSKKGKVRTSYIPRMQRFQHCHHPWSRYLLANSLKRQPFKVRFLNFSERFFFIPRHSPPISWQDNLIHHQETLLTYDPTSFPAFSSKLQIHADVFLSISTTLILPQLASHLRRST